MTPLGLLAWAFAAAVSVLLVGGAISLVVSWFFGVGSDE